MQTFIRLTTTQQSLKQAIIHETPMAQTINFHAITHETPTTLQSGKHS